MIESGGKWTYGVRLLEIGEGGARVEERKENQEGRGEKRGERKESEEGKEGKEGGRKK